MCDPMHRKIICGFVTTARKHSLVDKAEEVATCFPRAPAFLALRFWYRCTTLSLAVRFILEVSWSDMVLWGALESFVHEQTRYFDTYIRLLSRWRGKRNLNGTWYYFDSHWLAFLFAVSVFQHWSFLTFGTCISISRCFGFKLPPWTMIRCPHEDSPIFNNWTVTSNVCTCKHM